MTPWIAFIVAAVALAPDTAEFTSVDGQSISGVVAKWNGTQLTVKTGDGERQLSTDSLLDAAWPREAVPSSVDRSIELIDGSRLAYESFTIAKRVATIRLANSPRPLKMSTDKIHRIELLPSSEALQQALADIEQRQPAGDSLVIVKRDAAAMDYLTGVLGDVTAEQANFEWDGERVPVKLSKIAAIVFYHAKQAKLPATLCRVSLTDGSVIVARQAKLDGKQLRFQTPAGVELQTPTEQLARIDFSTGKIAYLSDLNPSSAKWIPRVAMPKELASISRIGLPRKNAAFNGAPLSLMWEDDPLPSRRDVRTYSRGLAVRSRTELVYLIPEGMSRFVLTAGIDPATAGQGDVTLEIRGDDKVLWEGTVDGRKPPVEIDVQLGAARRLQLDVGYGENLDFGDRLHMIEARFTK